MDDLRWQYANTPEFVATQVTTPGLPEAKRGVEGYWEVINGVPTFHETQVTTSGTGKAKEDLNGVWEVINGIPRHIPVSISLSVTSAVSDGAASLFGAIGGVGASIFKPKVKKATGGAIVGAGTATSDSIPALLSNGEHVLTAAEVAAAGGHGAIFALRKAILTGGVQFRAAGGPANASAYRAAPASFGGGSRGPSAAEIGAAVAAQMPPQVSVHSGADARSAARTAIHDWEWRQTQ